MLDSNWPKLPSPKKEGNQILSEITPRGESRYLSQNVPLTSGVAIQTRDVGGHKVMSRYQDEPKEVLKKSPINSINKFKCYTHTHQDMADRDIIKDGDRESAEDSKRDFGNLVQPTEEDKSTPRVRSHKKEAAKNRARPNKGFSIDAILERPHSVSSEETRTVKIDDENDDEDVDILPEIRDDDNEDDDEEGADNDVTDDVSRTTGDGRMFENFLPENLKHPLNCHPPPKVHPLPFLSGSRNAAIFSAAMLYRFLAKSKQNCQDFGLFHKGFQSFPYLNLPPHGNRFENSCFGGRSGFWTKGLIDESMERLYKPRPHHLKSYKDGVTQQPLAVQVEGQGWRSTEVAGERTALECSRENTPSMRRTGSGVEEDDDDDGFVVVDCGGNDTEAILNRERSKGGHEGEVSHHHQQSGQAEQIKEKKNHSTGSDSSNPLPWPAWVYCTRYSDRPSSGHFLINYANISFASLIMIITLRNYSNENMLIGIEYSLEIGVDWLRRW